MSESREIRRLLDKAQQDERAAQAKIAADRAAAAARVKAETERRARIRECDG